MSFSQLPASELTDWLSGIVNDAADAIVAMDEERNIVLFNKSAAAAFLVGQAEALGKPIAELIPSFRDTVVSHHATSARRTNGEEFAVDVTVSQTEVGGRTVMTAILHIADEDEIRADKAEVRADEAESAHRTIIDEMVVGFAVFDAVRDTSGNVTDVQCVFANPAFDRHTGLSRDAVVGRSVREALPWVEDPWMETYAKVAATGESAHFEGFVAPLNRWLDVTAFRVQRDKVGVTFNDATTRRRSAQQVLHLQKMEALGRLAGGIAHDFNNLMTIVRGSVEMALSGTLGTERATKNLTTVIEAVDRGTALVKQLMVFARQRSPSELGPVDLLDLLDDVSSMVPRLIGEQVEMKVVHSPNLEVVLGDSHQLFQVLVNIIVNAKDAMPDGGKITITADMMDLDGYYEHEHPQVKAGRYVRVSISDTGTGMTPEVKERMFDPFYTTKAEDKGTGLGLALVQGVMKTVGGHVTVYSEVGMGTVINLFFPSMKENKRLQEDHIEAGSLSGAVLVVEDELALRHIVCEVLVAQGYSVLEAINGVEAIEVARRHPDKIAIVVSDMVMPTMGGIEMVKHLRKVLKPGFGLVLMSGYNEFNERVEDDILVRTLRKPFAMNELLAAIREITLRKAG